MKQRDILELLLLSAIWGSSFIFMRASAPSFGPIPLIAVRVVIAAVFLSSILAWHGKFFELKGKFWQLAVLGTINSAIPFVLFAYATLSLNAGVAAVLNATAPLFAALVGLVLRIEKQRWQRLLGLLIGFLGVVTLVYRNLEASDNQLAVMAGLGAGLAYGIAAHFSQRFLSGVNPLVVSGGSQIAASLLLLPLAFLYWPSVMPNSNAWLCALLLGVMCTAVAYLLYFHLIQQVGPTRAMAVAYLIPVFAMVWGALWLSETITWNMVAGCVIVLAGTTLIARSSQKKRPQGAE